MSVASYSIDQIKTKLAPMKLSRVADGAGVSRATVYRLMRGSDVRASTLTKLSEHLKKLDEMIEAG